MARKLNTTVHLTDDRNRSHTFGPNDELPSWAEEKLREHWGDDRPDLWEAPAAPEELPVKEALDQGTPPPDREPVDQGEPQGRDKEAIELGQEVRTENPPAGVAPADPDEDDDAPKRRPGFRK